MRRNALIYLAEWLMSKGRKPLIIRGARQVGKTWLVREFAKQQELELIEVNFEQRPHLKSLFESNDPQQILLLFEATFHKTINPKNALLFLDEIQVAPELFAKLRWFAEKLPELPIIAAGSLLDFVLAEHEFSMPVGRITYLHLEPLSFEEFLLAQGKDKLLVFLQQFSFIQKIPESLHEQLTQLIKEYTIIGGMPAAVSSWVEEKSLTRVNQIHYDLLATYRDDFPKYAGRISAERLEEVMNAIPRLLGKKFVYRKVNADIQTTAVKKALMLLTQARLCSLVKASHANGVPLAAELNEKSFKVISLDVGLASALLGLRLTSLDQHKKMVLTNQGEVSEQLVGQGLRTLSPFYVEPALYYWTREAKSSAAEIDYVIQDESHVVPIEVKAGSTGTLRSLHLFMSLKKLSLGVRVNMDFPSLTSVNVQASQGESVSYPLLSIPIYLLGQLHRLTQEVFCSERK